MQNPVDDHLSGTLLEGRYDVGPRLARGGTAGVYRAVDQRLERTVAVKIMHAHLSEDPAFVDRFAREARAAARLSHPHAVSVLDQGRTDDGLVFLVMEYIEGGTLRDVLRRKAFLRPGEALEILAGIADGLAAAHRAGLIHRDIKPENVLMRPDGAVKVADFGLSRAADQHTTSGAVLGTVAYAAPELVTEQRVGTRSDVYSFGILAWEMLTGRRPFDGSPWAIAQAHAQRPVPSLLEAVPGLDPRLADAVSRWTSKEPSLRPESAVELLREISDLRRGLDAAALAHQPEGWEQGPGPIAPVLEDPGTTVLPSAAPATGPIDQRAVQAAAGAAASGAAAEAADADGPITEVSRIPLDIEAEAARSGVGPWTGTEGAPGTGTGHDDDAGSAVGGADADADATVAMPIAGGTDGPSGSAGEATEAMPGVGGAAADATEAMPHAPGRGAAGDATEAMPRTGSTAAGAGSGAAAEPDHLATAVLPTGIGAAGAAGNPGGSGGLGRTGSTAAAAVGAAVPVDGPGRPAAPDLSRLAAFEETSYLPVSADHDTAEEELDQPRSAARGPLQERTPVDAATPTVQLQPRRPLRAALALALAALLVALAAFLGWLLGSGSFATAVVPEVTGTSQEAAVSAVETEGFSNVTVRQESSVEVPEGTVIGTDPAAGAEPRVGEQIVITVSTGPEQVAVPQVEGLPQSEAQDRLSAAGLEVGTVTEQFDEAEAGTVVAVSPAQDVRVEQGAGIDLTVSAGPEPQDVPRVTGRSVDDARSELEGLGFTVEIEEIAGGSLGRVVSQSQDGTTITLRVI